MKHFSGPYSKQDLLYLKGIAILMIVLHNYLHWVPGYGVENEFSFDLRNTTTYLHRQWDGIFEFVKWNLSFWGHLGVVVFVFCSGYGLTRLRLNRPEPYLSYLYHRHSKLYLLLLLGMLVVAGLRLLNAGYFTPPFEFIRQFFKIASGIANVRESWYLSFSGPFWYFGLAIQLYLIFPLLYRFVQTQKLWASIILVAIVLASNIVFLPLATAAGIPLLANFPGHLPEFILGILLASGKLQFRFGWLSLLLSTAVLVGSQFSAYLFPLSFIAATTGIISLFELSKGMLQFRPLEILLRFSGTISMSLFIVNGVFRELKWFRDADNNLVAQRIIIYLPLLFAFSFAIHSLFNFLRSKLPPVKNKSVR